MSWYQRHTKTDLAARIEELEAAEAERDALKADNARLREVITEMGEVAWNRASAALQEKDR